MEPLHPAWTAGGPGERMGGEFGAIRSHLRRTLPVTALVALSNCEVGLGARLSLHQDCNERDFGQPIVSVSLGLPAIFLWGGKTRADKVRRVPLVHGDVVVWGGPDRLTFHGVHPVAEGGHPLTGACRFNFTFRKAL